jgi:DNA-binding MarR family transcriptional regulator
MHRAMSEQILERDFVTELDNLVFLVEEVPRKLRRVFDKSSAKLRLSRSQWRALAYIFRSPGLSQTELARFLELERASVGNVIDHLEMEGYVERRPVEGNRRVWTLHPLHKAIEILPLLRVDADIIYSRLFFGISEVEKAELRRLLKCMSENIA